MLPDVEAVVEQARKLSESAMEQIAKSRQSFESVAPHSAQMRASIAESKALLSRLANRPFFTISD